MQNGTPFNELLTPDPDNISRDTSYFLAWWSPGQYLTPAFFVATGLNLGQAISLTAGVFSVLGILGYFYLYQTLGFSRNIALVSCAIITSTRFFALPFGIYNGGELLLFGAIPWITLISMQCIEAKGLQYPLFILVFLLGSFLKLSFVVCAIAILTSLFIFNYSRTPGVSPLTMILYGAKLILTFITFYLILYATYISKGLTPVSYAWKISSPVTAILFALVGPLYSAFSIGDLINRLLRHPGNPVIHSYDEIIPLLLAFAAITAFLVVRIFRMSPGNLYSSLLFGFLITYVVIFSFFFLTGAPVSYEDRHFRAAGLLLVPGTVQVLGKSSKRIFRLPGFVAIVAFCVYGVISFFVRNEANISYGNVGVNGFTQHIISKEALSLLHDIDTKISRGNNMFYVTSPEIALEVRNNRVLSSHADFESLEALAGRRYHGQVDNLFIVLQQKLVENGKAEVILRSFLDYAYTGWKSLKIGAFVIYYQGNQTNLPWSFR